MQYNTRERGSSNCNFMKIYEHQFPIKHEGIELAFESRFEWWEGRETRVRVRSVFNNIMHNALRRSHPNNSQFWTLFTPSKKHLSVIEGFWEMHKGKQRFMYWLKFRLAVVEKYWRNIIEIEFSSSILRLECLTVIEIQINVLGAVHKLRFVKFRVALKDVILLTVIFKILSLIFKFWLFFSNFDNFFNFWSSFLKCGSFFLKIVRFLF